MSERFSLWWNERSPREQRLLLVMFGLIALLVAWLLVIRPLNDALESAKSRHAAAVEALARARGAANSPAAVRRGNPATRPLDAWLNVQAQEAGFAGARVAGEGPARASLAIDSARPQALFAFIRRVEEAGVTVETLRATVNSDQTLALAASFRAEGG